MSYDQLDFFIERQVVITFSTRNYDMPFIYHLYFKKFNIISRIYDMPFMYYIHIK